MNGGFYIISIHTPTQGVTKNLSNGVLKINISIHTPTQGVTGGGSGNVKQSDISIHTPTQGVTLDERYNYLMGVIS